MTSDSDLPARPANVAVIFTAAAPDRALPTWSAQSDPAPDRVEFLIEPSANGTTRVTINEHHARNWGEDHSPAAALGWAALLLRPQDACRNRPAAAPF